MIDGLLTEVIEDTRGSQTIAPIAAGGTQIPVDDISEFPEEGGHINIGGLEADYVTVELVAESVLEFPDPDVDDGTEIDPIGANAIPATTGILTLADPLTEAVEEDEPVLLMVGTEVATDAWAVVDFLAGDGDEDGGDTVQIPIDYSQRVAFPIGIYEPPVMVQVTDDLTAIVTVPGVRPIVDGGLIDPDTLPLPDVPTDPPETSPAPVMVGNVRIILGSLTPVPAASDYDIYLASSTAATPGPNYLVGTTNASQFQITNVPTALVPTPEPGQEPDPSLRNGTDYYVALVARNNIGSADPSPWVGPVRLREVGEEEISAAWVYAGTVFADQIRAGELSSVINLSGKFTTRAGVATSPGGEMDAQGLRGYGVPAVSGEDAPLQISIPFTGDEAFFNGKVAARRLTSYQGADLFSINNYVKEGGALALEAGVGGRVAAPVISQFVPSIPLERPTTPSTIGTAPNVTFNAAQCRGLNWNYVRGAFQTVQNVPGACVHWYIYPDGRVQWFLARSSSTGNLSSSGRIRRDADTEAELYQVANSWLITVDSGPTSVRLNYTRVNPAQTPAFGYAAGDDSLRIAELVPNSNGIIRIRRFNFGAQGQPPSEGVTRDTNAGFWTVAGPVGSLQVGPGDFGTGVSVFTPYNNPASPIRVTTTPGGTWTNMPEHAWEQPVALVGVAMDAPTSQAGSHWYGLGTDNRLYEFTPNTWGTGVTARHVAAATMATASAESRASDSDQVEFNLNKRWQINATAPALVNPATRAAIYLWRGASGSPAPSQLARQGFTAGTLTIPTPNYSGPAPGSPPTSGTLPALAPALLYSEAQDAYGPVWWFEGDGDYRLAGMLRTESGTGNVGSAIAQYASADVAVTFATPFPVPPEVTVNGFSTWGGIFMILTRTTTGFTMRVANVRNAAYNVGFYWVAIGRT